MGQIKVTKCAIPGLCVIEPAVHADDRGFFMETYNRRDLEEAGLNVEFVQDNQSMSVKGVLRGLHFQKRHPQHKLIRVISGRIFDAAVDLRPDSPTFGQWFGLELSAENRKQLYIPQGFAHGFLVLSETAEVCYKVSDFFSPGDEGGIIWNDPAIGIRWPGVTEQTDDTGRPIGCCLPDGTPLLLSPKDRQWKSLHELPEFLHSAVKES